MKKISLWLFIFALTAWVAHGQDDATQQQLDKLNGQIQDLVATQDAQGKRIAALEKEIGELRDKSNSPGAAGQDELKKLAEQIQEIDKKRQQDRELILKEIEKLGKTGGVSAPAAKPKPTLTPLPTTGGKEQVYEYVIHEGDRLSAIAKAYRDQGTKVTTDQILKANPGLNPNNLKVGQKIFIPAPTP
jgi:nucleoid-associated protein YgaU